MTTSPSEDVITVLKARFVRNSHRHTGVSWDKVLAKLGNNEKTMTSLIAMEETGGEPDLLQYDQTQDAYVFFDCSPESPIGRRSLCYDQEALESRREHKPKNSAVNVARAMGIELLDEQDYRKLQSVITCDRKTSSWVKTPPEIRKLGGALFCDHRYGQVFVYHNGAESYYAARGFRGKLVIL
ncbi:hypothetical protein LBMAG53_34590 [Planctomycetota bacterium]|nr:hypothetical protein LBMAG53_34590 [Planctomycetota bacterium]